MISNTTLNTSTSSHAINNPSSMNSGSMSPNSPISPASPPQHIVAVHHQPPPTIVTTSANLLNVVSPTGSSQLGGLLANNRNQMRKSVTVQNQQNLTGLTSSTVSTTNPTATSSSGATATTIEYINPQDVNVLLDPDVINDYPTQALVLTVLATLVRNTTDENEIRVLYQYIAEASIVFPKGNPHECLVFAFFSL